jgi:hypothetical protein
MYIKILNFYSVFIQNEKKQTLDGFWSSMHGFLIFSVRYQLRIFETPGFVISGLIKHTWNMKHTNSCKIWNVRRCEFSWIFSNFQGFLRIFFGVFKNFCIIAEVFINFWEFWEMSFQEFLRIFGVFKNFRSFQEF